MLHCILRLVKPPISQMRDVSPRSIIVKYYNTTYYYHYNIGSAPSKNAAHSAMCTVVVHFDAKCCRFDEGTYTLAYM